MSFEELLKEQLSGDIIKILNDEFAIGNYAIEGKPKARSGAYVFARIGDKLGQFCVVSPNFIYYKHWFKLHNIANLPDVDIYKNDLREWRDRNIRFMNLIAKNENFSN